MRTARKDYYRVLQVDSTAEQEVIEAAYRRLAHKYHPDLNPAPDAVRQPSRRANEQTANHKL